MKKYVTIGLFILWTLTATTAWLAGLDFTVRSFLLGIWLMVSCVLSILVVIVCEQLDKLNRGV